jgi:hypothetical protein
LVRGVASEVRRQGGSPGVLQLKIGTS